MRKKRSDRRSGFIKFLLSFFAAISAAGIGLAVGTGKGYSASTSEAFSVDGLSLNVNSTATDAMYYDFNSNGNDIISKVKSKSGGCDSDTAYTNTITLTVNETMGQGIILFDITKNDTYTASFTNSYQGETLKGGESVVISHTSNNTSNYSEVTISNIKFVEIKNCTTTFTNSAGGGFHGFI